jgi:hypothetical protein
MDDVHLCMRDFMTKVLLSMRWCDQFYILDGTLTPSPPMPQPRTSLVLFAEVDSSTICYFTHKRCVEIEGKRAIKAGETNNNLSKVYHHEANSSSNL